jgi:hypothetical protein
MHPHSRGRALQGVSFSPRRVMCSVWVVSVSVSLSHRRGRCTDTTLLLRSTTPQRSTTRRATTRRTTTRRTTTLPDDDDTPNVKRKRRLEGSPSVLFQNPKPVTETIGEVFFSNLSNRVPPSLGPRPCWGPNCLEKKIMHKVGGAPQSHGTVVNKKS